MNNTEMKQPDPRKHQMVSFFKSALRVAAGLTLAAGLLGIAGFFFIVAEILGVVEELV